MKLKNVAVALMTGLLGASVAFAAMPEKLNIVYVPSPFNLQNMVMKEQGLLEKAFAKDGTKVTWHTINSGAKQGQAMAAGDIDMSAVMNTTSLLLNNAAGNPVYIASGVAHPSKVFAIVGKPGATLSVKDLKGKKVAGPAGTVLHQLLLAALAKEGMSANDVEFLNMGLPQALTAVSTGQVDAALLAASLVIKAEGAGCHVIKTAEGLVNVNLVMTATKAFWEKYPDAVQKVVDVEKAALEWIKAHPEEAIALGAKLHGISIEDAKKLADWSNYYQYLNQTDIDGLKADLAFLKSQGKVQGYLDVEKLVLPTAFAPKAK